MAVLCEQKQKALWSGLSDKGGLGSGVVFHPVSRDQSLAGTGWKWAYESQFHGGTGDPPVPCWGGM